MALVENVRRVNCVPSHPAVRLQPVRPYSIPTDGLDYPVASFSEATEAAVYVRRAVGEDLARPPLGLSLDYPVAFHNHLATRDSLSTLVPAFLVAARCAAILAVVGLKHLSTSSFPPYGLRS